MGGGAQLGKTKSGGFFLGHDLYLLSGVPNKLANQIAVSQSTPPPPPPAGEGGEGGRNDEGVGKGVLVGACLNEKSCTSESVCPHRSRFKCVIRRFCCLLRCRPSHSWCSQDHACTCTLSVGSAGGRGCV